MRSKMSTQTRKVEVARKLQTIMPKMIARDKLKTKAITKIIKIPFVTVTEIPTKKT
jgi:hypothetical protein